MRVMPVSLHAPSPSSPQSEAKFDDAQGRVFDRSIGDFIRQARQLSEEQVREILAFQRDKGLRFGEAAIALQLASHEDVLWALSQQFHYPYAPHEGGNFNEELVTAIDPFSDQAEVFRELRSQLMMGVLAPDQPRRALAVVSPDIGDGKSFFAANLAVSFSQLGGRTLLLDADMRTSRLHRVFGVANRTGLSSVLSNRCEADVIQPVKELPSLFVMPVGTLPPNPLELMQRPSFGLLMQELLVKFDHVVVDTPAAVHGADARVLAAQSGAAVVIARRGTTRMSSLQGLLSGLAKGPSKLAGVLMNAH